nr:Aminotransferase class-V [uncultured bacterium]
MARLKLMIPGPIEVEDDVLEWMGSPIQAHYGDQWLAVHNETIALLKQIIGTSGYVYMLPGSGSLGLDAAVQSTFAPGSKVAIGNNGNFGRRLTEILEANGVIPVPVLAEPTEALNPQTFDALLTADTSIVGVAAVHLETSTAVLNPVQAIAAIARRHNRLSLIDTVSSLGGTLYEMDNWDIDITVTASQKGLGGAPGVAIVAVGPRAWEAISPQPDRPRSWYLDLRRWQWYAEHWADWHPFPVTVPTSVILGMRAALQSIQREGLGARLEHYETLASQLRNGLRALGLSPAVDDDIMAPVLTAVFVPDGIRATEIVKYLADQHSIKITTGFGDLKEKVIRIGHMGGKLNEDDIDTLLVAIRQFLAERQGSPAK